MFRKRIGDSKEKKPFEVMNKRESDEFQRQSPISFSPFHVNQSRFGKWVKYKDGKKKKRSLFSKQKEEDYVLVYTRANEFHFFKDENEDGAPSKVFFLDGGYYHIQNSKKRKVDVYAYERKSDETTDDYLSFLNLQCLNRIDFNELIRCFRESNVEEKVRMSKKKKKIRQTPLKRRDCDQESKNNKTVFNSIIKADSIMDLCYDERFDSDEEEEGEEEEEEEKIEIQSKEIPKGHSVSSVRSLRRKKRVEKRSRRSSLDKIDDATKVRNQVVHWDTESVLQWSKFIPLGKTFEETLHDFIFPIVRKEEINGLTILTWSDEEIASFVKRFEKKLLVVDRIRVKEEIKKLKTHGYYDVKSNSILMKIVKMIKYQSPNRKLLRGNVFRLSESLGSPKRIKQSILEILYGQDSPQNSIKTKNKSSSMNTKEEEFSTSRYKNRTFPVKVNIVENLKKDREKRFRKLIGVFFEIKDKFMVVKTERTGDLFDEDGTKFGIFHASFSVGRLQLEWVSAEIVIIRPVASENAILCSDVGQITVPDGEVFAERLAEEVVKWNAFYRYKNFGMGQKKKKKEMIRKMTPPGTIEMMDIENMSSSDINENNVDSSPPKDNNNNVNSLRLINRFGGVATSTTSTSITTSGSVSPKPLSTADFDSMTANCQHFVQKMLSFMKIDWEFPRRVRKFINSMKYTGQAEKVFRFGRKFSETFIEHESGYFTTRLENKKKKKKKKKKIGREFRPQSHMELDWFVRGCFKICPTFERDFNEEYMLLKCFDRAYWMRYRAVEIKSEKKMRSAFGDKEESVFINDEVFKNVRPAKRKKGEFWRLSGCPFTK